MLLTGMALTQSLRLGSITLRRLADELRREFAAASWLDGQLVDRDIPHAAMKPPVAGCGPTNASERQLEKLGITEEDWCKQELSCDIGTMRRRVQLAKGWDQYRAQPT